MPGDMWRERAGRASRRLHCAADQASMEADQRGSAIALALIPAGTEAIRMTKRRVANLAGPFPFGPKSVSPAPPGAPQRAGFVLGPPAPVSAQTGEKRAPVGTTGPFFARRC